VGSSLITLLLVTGAPGWASEVDVTGRIQTDARYRLTDVPAGAWYAPTGVSSGFERVETTLGGSINAEGDGLIGYADLQLVATSQGAQVGTLADLANRGSVDPVQLEINEAFVELWDVGLMGLDLRVGHQLVQWGVGDQFNPTNNLNADDLEDPLQFGKQLPNTMIRADYAMGPMWTLSGVLVPMFRPAMLPPTSAIGVAFTDRIPVIEDDVRRQIQAEQALARDSFGYPTIVSGVQVLDPARSANNMAAMARLGGSIGAQDVALSWYTGHSDIPQPIRNYTRLQRDPTCHPARPDECIKGYMMTEAEMAFPRMHVAGLNVAGELDALGWMGASPLGWRLEAALVMPQRLTIAIENDELGIDPSLVQPAGEYDYGLDGERPTVVDDAPFAKWTLGLDYTFGKHVYMNAQWVHGMPDEFGAGDFIQPDFVTRAGGSDWEIRRLRIGDYLVIGSDIALGGATLRLFGLLDLTGYQTEQDPAGGGERGVVTHAPFSEDGFSAVLYPELMVSMGNGIKGGIGTVQLFGRNHTKFGDPAAGGDLFFVRGSYEL
jgi:hypothetical protein